MKKVYAWCFRILGYSGDISSETPTCHVTIRNCSHSKLITMIANDGYVYPLDDVDDIEDWNILFDMLYMDSDRQVFNIPIHVISKMRKVSVSFDKCKEPIKSKGDDILDKAIRKFVSKKKRNVNV